jgi:uncharacterized membrane protein SpoIIM required for sporulation
MKESSFIKQNISKWSTYEGEIQKKKKDPKLVSKLFVQITDDLSYAQTFYKNRSVRVYLNGIAQLLFNDINKSKRIKFSSFANFWKTELPVIMYKIRFELLFSFVFFSICVGIGIITSMHDSEFARTILGDRYVNMTLENIEKNDPMAVYKQRFEAYSFMYITLNNIKVAFITFVFGIFFGFGTLVSLLRNGIMLGTFQYFFIERNLFKDSFLTIWQHGTLEISSIVIAGAAGFTIGRGLLIPGTFTRFQSLKITARRGLKVMIGLIPVFIFAAFIEAFVTRYTELPDIIRLFTIIFSLGFIIFYFVLYPVKVAKKFPEKLEQENKISQSGNKIPDLTTILNNELLFGGTLICIKKILPVLTKVILITSVIFALILSFGHVNFLPSLTDTLYEQRFAYGFLLNYRDHLYVFLINTLFTCLVSYVGFYHFNKLIKNNLSPTYNKGHRIRLFINSLITAIFINICFFLPAIWGLLFVILIAPVLFVNLQTCTIENKFFFSCISKSFQLTGNSFSKFLLLNLKFMFIGGLLLILLSPRFYGSSLQIIKWNLWLEDNYIDIVLNSIILFIFYAIVSISQVLLLISNALIYYSMKEQSTGYFLKQRISKIGVKNTLRGYELEN